MQRLALAAVMVITGACGVGADTIAERTDALTTVKGHFDRLFIDSVDCGTFQDNFTDRFSIDTLNFFDSQGSRRLEVRSLEPTRGYCIFTCKVFHVSSS